MRSAARRIKWYHSFTFPDGTVVSGNDNSEAAWEFLSPMLPDLAGKDVLDIGAWDGFYSYRAKQCGARRVLATDYYCWNGPGWGTKDGFDLAGRFFGIDVESMNLDPLHIYPETVGTFDVVLLLGVLYHRPDCFQTLANAAGVCRQTLVVETLIQEDLDEDRPLLQFYPFDELYGDPTNWFAPNIRCVYDMLRSCGFTEIRHKTRTGGWGPNQHIRGAFVAERS